MGTRESGGTAEGKRKKKTGNLEDQAWYHGTLPRDEISRLLKEDGMFLVRVSADENGRLRPVISVKAGEQLRHVHVESNQEKQWHLGGESFPTIPSLILHYYQTKTPISKKTGAILRIAVKREKWLLDDRNLKQERLLGSGAFGEVWLGTLKRDGKETMVAIKRDKSSMRAMTQEERMQTLGEAKQMFHYEHENVVRLFGIACDKPPIRIVMEYCPAGSLDEHLKNNEKKLPLVTKLRYALEAARGMAYLSNHKCIHRDLAARNCLIGAKGEIKISDFGLSKRASAYKMKNMKSAKIAIRWTAPEALAEGKFSEAADVWSFGVLMWEIFAYGQLPWAECRTNLDVFAKVKIGEKMKPPEGTPDSVYAVMVKCWEMKTKDRITFQQLEKEVFELVTQSLSK